MIEQLKKLIEQSDNIVFFGGAGVSTASGIPDFRSTDGLFHQKYKYPPETILSSQFYHNHTDEFYEFYRDKMLFLEAEPNACHKALAKLEEQGKVRAVITQNIDGLHQKAGSENVFELHGSVLRNYCLDCHKSYPVDKIIEEELPTCECSGIIKPDVVLYGEGLDNDTIDGAIKAISEADVLIIGGTSLAVYPAASFLNYYRGDKLVVINKSSLSVEAHIVINDSIATVFEEIVVL
ncbi:MAG: NAD-dependent protein deacylase [Bacillota bacterium]